MVVASGSKETGRLRSRTYILHSYLYPSFTTPQVTKGKKWADIGRLLGYGGIPGLSTQMKNSYARVILPYEHFQDRVKNSPNMSILKHHDPQLKTHQNMQTKGSSSSNGAKPNGEDSPPSSPLTATSSPLSEPPDEADHRLRRSTRQTSQDQTRECPCHISLRNMSL